MKEKWMKIWGGFEEKHPKLAKWLYQIFYFFIFSMGVTILQYLFFTFMPYALGEGLAATEFMWPQIHMELFGVPFTWSLLDIMLPTMPPAMCSSAAVWDTLSAMKSVHLLLSASTFRCSATLHLRAKAIRYFRPSGILSHGL